MVADVLGGAGYAADLYRTPPRDSEPALINTTSARDAAVVAPVERSANDQSRAADPRQARSSASDSFGQAGGDRLDASTNAALLQAQEARVQDRPPPPPPPQRPPAEAAPQARDETTSLSSDTDEETNALAATLTSAREAEIAQRQARAVEDRAADDARETRRVETQSAETRPQTENARPPEPQTRRDDAPAPAQADDAETGLNAADSAAQAVNPTTAALEQSSAVSQSEPRNAAAEATPVGGESDTEDVSSSGPNAIRSDTDTVNEAEAEVRTPNTQFETRFARADSGLSTRDDGVSRTDPNPSTADRLNNTAPDPQRPQPVSQPLDNNLDGAVTPQEIAQGGLNLTV